MPPKGLKNPARQAAFERIFNPEYLAARKDISQVMLQCAQGKLDQVAKFLEEEHNKFEIFTINRDGNSMLLVAVANQHVNLTKLLLDLKSELDHRNSMHMDALDYALMHGVRTPIAKAVLNHCDYVVPEALEGVYWHKSLSALRDLKDDGVLVATTSHLGKTPDFVNPHARDAEYTVEWLSDLHYAVGHTKKGLLLLSHEIGYLEKDALMTGALEVPEAMRAVYMMDTHKAIRYASALKRTDIYGQALEKRIIDACCEGDFPAVQGVLKAKASANVEDVYGQTALMRACKIGDSKIVRALLLNKAIVDQESRDGYSALLIASVNNHGEVARMLLRCKADAFKKTCKGNAVMSFIQHEGHRDIIKIINEEHDRQLKKQAPRFAPKART